MKYMIRRMFRVAKYAAIGATVAVVGTTVLGALGTSMAWFAAPSLGMGIGTGIIWGLAKVSLAASGARRRAVGPFGSPRDLPPALLKDNGGRRFWSRGSADSSSGGDTAQTVSASRGGSR